MKELENKITLVTGSGQGLGKAIASTLAKDGATVIIADVNEENARKTAGEIGGNAIHLSLNIGDEQSIKNAFTTIKEKFGRINFVINNAGVDVTKPIEELTTADIDKVLNINLRGTFLMCKYALEQMYTQKSGHIVNIASTAAKRAWSDASAYHASKWGVLGLSRGLYVEARKHQVKVSTVIPGGMRTPFILERFPDTPLDKLQDPQNVANTVKFVLIQPEESIIPEVMVIPMQESSWP